MIFFFDRNINDEQMWTGERKIGMGGMRETKSRKLKQNSNKHEKKLATEFFWTTGQYVGNVNIKCTF